MRKKVEGRFPRLWLRVKGQILNRDFRWAQLYRTLGESILASGVAQVATGDYLPPPLSGIVKE